MRKFLVSLVILALVAPAMADVAVTTDTGTAGELTITLTADGTTTTEIVGVGLTVDSAAAIDNVYIVESFFDVFIDSAFTIGAGYAPPAGIPTATQGAPGELALPATSFSISVGGLDDDGIGAGTEEAPLTCTIVLECAAGSADVDICPDTLRGSVVSYAGAETVTGLCANDLVITEAGPSECVKSDAPFYAEWVGDTKPWDRPDCWCYIRQCRGDADGAKVGQFRVQGDDLAILVSAFNQGDKKLDQTKICADFDHKKVGQFRVQGDDLAILVANFNLGDKKYDECPLDWDGDLDDDYNFWITP